MGCTSSTEVVTNPHTGQQKLKKTCGGAYPGMRKPQLQPYTPPESAFQGGSNQATAHFVAYGGGNALTLVRQDGSTHPQTGGKLSEQPQFIQVTLPSGVSPGDTIHVQAPDGRVNAIVVPEGFQAGSTFTVEFAPEPVKYEPEQFSKPSSDYNNNNTTTYAINNNNHTAGGSSVPPDDFATGFGNPYSRPPTVAATAVPVTEPEVIVSPYHSNDSYNYPTTSATPVYPAPPQYPTATTIGRH